MYNILAPLMDISEDGDGTIFWPAPALGDESSRALAKHTLDAPGSTLDASASDVLGTPAGRLVIFDYVRARSLRLATRERAKRGSPDLTPPQACPPQAR